MYKHECFWWSVEFPRTREVSTISGTNIFWNIMFTDEELDAMYPNILHQSESHHDSEDQGTSEKHGVAFDQ